MHQFSSVFTMATSEVDHSNLSALPADFTGFDNETLNFSGFMDTSMVFEPPFYSSMTSTALNTRLANIPPEERSLNFDISEMSEGEEDCSEAFDEAMFFPNHSTDENPQSVSVQSERDSEEDILDISPAFNVLPEEEEMQVKLIIKGSALGNNVVVSKDYGHAFNRNKPANKTDGSETHRCKGYGKYGCKAQVRLRKPLEIMRDRGIEPDTGVHIIDLKPGVDFWVTKPEFNHHSDNCPTLPGNYEKILVVNECKRLALNPLYDSVHARNIVKEAKAEYITIDTPTQVMPNEHNLCKMINRVRQAHRARPPRADGSDILEFELLLERLPEEVSREFYRGSVTSEYNGGTFKHFIFFSDTQKQYIRQSKHILVDATFGIVKKPHVQLLTMHAQASTAGEIKVNLPIAYVLMQNKSESAYKAVFQKIKDIADEEGPSQAQEFIVDYEKAIWNALRAVWVGVPVRGCWFHFNQAIYRKVRSFEVGNAFHSQAQTHKMVRRLMALPLVDRGNIPPLFETLKEKYAPQINNPGAPGVRKLFEYFEEQWIQGTARGFCPADYSCYKKKIRTTNIVESWNCRIFRAGNQKKNNIYQLALVLARETARCLANITQYAANNYRRRAQVEKDRKIKRAYEIYDATANSWDLLENLRAATTKTSRYTPGELAIINDQL